MFRNQAFFADCSGEPGLLHQLVKAVSRVLPVSVGNQFSFSLLTEVRLQQWACAHECSSALLRSSWHWTCTRRSMMCLSERFNKVNKFCGLSLMMSITGIAAKHVEKTRALLQDRSLPEVDCLCLAKSMSLIRPKVWPTRECVVLVNGLEFCRH